MSKPININASLSFHPSSIDSTNSNYASVSSSYPISNGYDNNNSTTYAQFSLNTGNGATTYVYYNFDTSEIPEGATIESVTCSAKAVCTSTNSSRITARQMQMCTGTTTKGSAYTLTTSATSTTLTVGTWTLAELRNAKIRCYVQRGSSNTSSNYYIRFYGATLTVNYSINGIAYTITSTSSVDGIEATPATQDIMAGETAVVRIDAESLNNINITDNDVDIFEELEQHETPTGGTEVQYPNSYTTSGSISGTNYQAAVGKGSDTASTSGNDYCSSSGSTAHIDYAFDFSNIPENATIDSVSVTVKGHCESTSNSSEVATLRLYSGSTAKGDESEFTSTTDSIITMTTGTWTREELQNAILRFTIGYYGGRVSGVTWTVTYSMPVTNPYYWTYQIRNISTDHVILIEESGPFIPPEEDENYNYYPITISSINATTSPRNGTERIKEGENVIVTISPIDPQLTLALDNGVDITSQLVGNVPANNYTITTQVSGASYGFNLNSSTGYYVSSNNGVSKSASVARVNMNFESDCLVTITYINYAEANYDYGMFGKLDTTIATDGLTASSNSSIPSDSTSNYQLAMCSNSSNTQTITYQVPAGEHFIDIKYGKDDASDSNNDSLQWKITNIEAINGGGDYTYTLTNINQKHSLIFVFGDVDYYFITTAGTGAKLYPDGQSVVLDGFDYTLTIVPNNTTDNVTLTDNNIDKTSSLVREQATISGKTIVNYTYEITNVTATHNLVITSSSQQTLLYIRENSTWRQYTKAYKKINGQWVQQTDLTSVFNQNINYRRGN